MSNSHYDYFELKGKVALVTGASSGLGRHFASVLAMAGCKVVVTARRMERLQQLQHDLEASDACIGSIHPYALDVVDSQRVDATIDDILAQFGNIDILINNAGVGKASRFLDADNADTDHVFDVNQKAVWQVAQSVARKMVLKECRGSIINIASVLGLRLLTGAASYSVSKAAVIQMTGVMALELARHGIRANAIAPGYFPTEMNREFLQSPPGLKILSRSPMRRAGELEELDGLLLLLASDRSKFITGATIPVDGGHVISSL